MGRPARTRHDASGLLSLAVGLSLLLLWCDAKAKPDGLCIPREREALLRFKRDLTDPSNRLSSWVEEEEEDHPHTDCCAWSGVVCHNSTGHVLQLRLACTPSPSTHYCSGFDDDKTKKVLGGKLNPSLLNLKHLTHLDLSYNDFQGAPIPTFLASLENLRYLNLSNGEFGGAIPRQLTNLSSLQSLDLINSFPGYVLSSSSLAWAAGLTSLQFLGLSRVDLSRAHDWLQVTSRLPSLQQLILSSCHLPHTTPTSLPPINFSSLSVLDLSFNRLSWVPAGWIFTLPALTSLSLSDNNLQGPIPVGLANLTALTTLDISFSQLNSSLPKWLFDLGKLEDLNLRGNSLQGRIPEAIGNMTSLTTLDLEYNTELEADGGWLFKWLGNLGRLRRVYLSGLKFGRNNTLVKDVKSLSSGLIDLYLSGAQLWGQFSDLVDHFSNLAWLDLSNNSLEGSIPESIGKLSSLESLDVSDNQLSGPIPVSIGRIFSLKWLDVSDNQLSGPIPVSIGRFSD